MSNSTANTIWIEFVADEALDYPARWWETRIDFSGLGDGCTYLGIKDGVPGLISCENVGLFGGNGELIINSTGMLFGNNVSTTFITVPTDAQIADGSYVLNANGQWAPGSTVVSGNNIIVDGLTNWSTHNRDLSETNGVYTSYEDTANTYHSLTYYSPVSSPASYWRFQIEWKIIGTPQRALFLYFSNDIADDGITITLDQNRTMTTIYDWDNPIFDYLGYSLEDVSDGYQLITIEFQTTNTTTFRIGIQPFDTTFLANAKNEVYTGDASSAIVFRNLSIAPRNLATIEDIQLNLSALPAGYTGSSGPAGGYTGSVGYVGSKGDPGGYTGSQGISGYTGSGGLGYTGSGGYTGSSGAYAAIGYTGSKGVGYTGSFGYTGSLGIIGYTGSQGTGYTGSQGTSGNLGYTGSGGLGYTGSQGNIGYVGSQGTPGSPGGYTGSTGYVGSKGDPGGYTGSQGSGYTGSAGIGGGGFEANTTAPSSPTNGYEWFNLTTGLLYKWINDGDSSQWIEIGPSPIGYTGSIGSGYTGSIGSGYTGSVGSISATGANTQVLFNDSGTINAVANLTFDKTTGTLTVNGTISTGNTAIIELGSGITANQMAYIDFHSVTGTDFETRLVRFSGHDGEFKINNWGNGGIYLASWNSGAIVFQTNNATRMNIDANGTVNITPPTGGYTQALHITQTGPNTGNQSSSSFNTITVNDGTHLNVAGQSTALLLEHNILENHAGQKYGLYVSSTRHVVTANDGDQIAAVLFCHVTANAGGTSTTNTGSKGSVYGSNPNVYLGPSAQNYNMLAGEEIDVTIDTGGSSRARFGLIVASAGPVHGAEYDTAIEIAGSATGWYSAMMISSLHGGAGLTTNGSIITSDGTTQTIQDVINLSTFTISNNILNFPKLRVTGNAGVIFTSANLGVKNSGSYIIDPALGSYQYASSNGAHGINAASSDCAVDIVYTNGTGAGAVTFNGFTYGSGSLNTTSGNKFWIQTRRVNTISIYNITALQ